MKRGNKQFKGSKQKNNHNPKGGDVEDNIKYAKDKQEMLGEMNIKLFSKFRDILDNIYLYKV